MKVAGCPLCDRPGGVPVFDGPKFRVIRVDDEPGLPAYYRLVWTEHVAEFSELPDADRRLCIDAVVRIEEILRAHLRPKKVNLATLGNVVPHLHWHIVARFEWDSHFPGTVWQPPAREAPRDRVAAVEASRPALEHSVASALASVPGKHPSS